MHRMTVVTLYCVDIIHYSRLVRILFGFAFRCSKLQYPRLLKAQLVPERRQVGISC
jgi:hypothetical protein